METEKIIDEFWKGKRDLKERMTLLKERLKDQEIFCKAVIIQQFYWW